TGRIEMPSAPLGEVRLHYRDDGDGQPALLLVHGWGGDGRAWDPIAFTGHRVVNVDLRGHGRSSVPAQGYRPIDMATDLVRLAEHLRLGRVVALGHSMGAQVVTAMAVEYPGSVRALVVVDPAYGADEREEATFAQRLAQLRADGAAAASLQLGELP